MAGTESTPKPLLPRTEYMQVERVDLVRTIPVAGVTSYPQALVRARHGKVIPDGGWPTDALSVFFCMDYDQAPRAGDIISVTIDHYPPRTED